MASHYQDLCYRRVCSCRPSGGQVAASAFLPDNELTLAAGKVRGIFDDFQNSSLLFRETGGVHGVGFYTAAGPVAMMVSCRVNQEIVRMANRAGIKILLARGAPSFSAYRDAARSGLTLVGFVRADHFTVLSGKERIVS